MYKVKKIILFLARFYISFSLRNKKVYVVTGLRRSGNHAFINWFTNALEDRETSYCDLEHQVYITDSGKTLFYNEVNHLGVLWFISALRSTIKHIKDASFIIVSLEDYIPGYKDTLVPKDAVKISIRRNTLNLIASRLKYAQKQAMQGLDRGDMTISDHLIAFLKWQRISEESDWNTWSFDDWIENENYRSEFLRKMNLNSDIIPGISTQGDGSSFSGQSKVPSKKDLKNRLTLVEWPKRVIELLYNIADTSILTEEEKSFVSTQLERINRNSK